MNSKAAGAIGEERAARYLASKGYKIILRNAVICGAEIDIVAQFRDVTVFCEVKTRASRDFGLPMEAVGRDKMRRYVRAAEAYMVRHRLFNRDVRFDVLEVTDGGINHIEAAFDASDAAKRGKY